LLGLGLLFLARVGQLFFQNLHWSAMRCSCRRGPHRLVGDENFSLINVRLRIALEEDAQGIVENVVP
jgi:hypothetical protein